MGHTCSRYIHNDILKGKKSPLNIEVSAYITGESHLEQVVMRWIKFVGECCQHCLFTYTHMSCMCSCMCVCLPYPNGGCNKDACHLMWRRERHPLHCERLRMCAAPLKPPALSPGYRGAVYMLNYHVYALGFPVPSLLTGKHFSVSLQLCNKKVKVVEFINFSICRETTPSTGKILKTLFKNFFVFFPFQWKHRVLPVRLLFHFLH